MRPVAGTAPSAAMSMVIALPGSRLYTMYWHLGPRSSRTIGHVASCEWSYRSGMGGSWFSIGDNRCVGRREYISDCGSFLSAPW
ncbi:hypothetical protein GDO81_019796 [Engystomops pustulosus]|uniref:Secreted protein n=1 Tax=Engystomops pustulosus TaxID=76066 RepID=A0AAV6ZN60_ENGPU|nr:hypothetical protein GDO81_019796 [Engystomops pustulosus]